MQCPKGCLKCNLTAEGKVACTQCTRTPLDPATGECQAACATPNCYKCLPDGESPACQQCEDGFGLVGSACQACKVAGCWSCNDDPATCSVCSGRETVVNGTACVACPPGCLSCGDPGSCAYCVDGNLTWDAAKRSCVPCAAQGCDLCAEGRADKCQASGL